MNFPSVHLKFPKDFLWSTGDSAFQVEGGLTEGGRGTSIWDVFCHTPGRIDNGHNADIACDRYHRYKEDIDLMAKLGIKAYRFSISWPRIHPNGDSQVNPEGIAFYTKILNYLDEKKIEPWITLFHWELPQKLFERGGWKNRTAIDEFATFTKTMAEAFGSRVKGWVVLNEPYIYATLGYLVGKFPPGEQNMHTCLTVLHNQLVAQGKAVQILRKYSPNSKIGTAIDIADGCPYPLVNNDENCAVVARYRDFGMHQILDPIILGKYTPISFLKDFDYRKPGDLEIIHQQLDFIGINYYTHKIVAFDNNPELLFSKVIPETSALTEMSWKISPKGLFDTLVHLNNRYNSPHFIITENGAAFQDIVEQDGIIQDEDRIAYLRDHLVAIYRALQAGIKVDGYMLWTLLDNFEWARGYTMKFGIVHVDRTSLKRTPKKSFYWYKDVIAREGLRFP